MDAIREHLQAHYLYYVLAAVILLPPFLYFRRYTLPLLFYTIEFCIYAVIMHTTIFVLAVCAAWFRENTQMQVVRDVIRQNPHWKTPILRFWETKQYNPSWLVYLEAGLLALILLAMWKYRPLAVQKPKKKAPPKKPGMYSSQWGGKTQFGGKK